MKRIRAVGLLSGILLVVAACEPPSGELLPTQPELAVPEEAVMSEEIREAMGPECTFLKCTLCPVTAPECHQQCIYTGRCREIEDVDRNQNGMVCSATEGLEGPFMDDVWPQPAVLRMRPEVVDPCPSPAFPHWIGVDQGG